MANDSDRSNNDARAPADASAKPVKSGGPISGNEIGPFPDRPPPRSDRPPATIANIEHLLNYAGIKVRYNEVSKRDEIEIPNRAKSTDNFDNVTLTHIISLVAEHHIPTGNVPGFVEAIANKNAYNPVEDWIRSRPWDGTDRLPNVYQTVVPAEGYPDDLREVILRKWLRSVSAAARLARPLKPCRA